MSRFKTQFCIIPRRLAARVENPTPNEPSLKFVGWVWMQRAALVENYNHGWISVVGREPDQDMCSKCGQVMR
jgi:hypothetical protein